MSFTTGEATKKILFARYTISASNRVMHHRHTQIYSRENASITAQARCIRLYESGRMSKATKEYRSDLYQQERSMDQVRDCTFRPATCQYNPNSFSSYPAPQSFDSAVNRVRRGNDIRRYHKNLLTPRRPMFQAAPSAATSSLSIRHDELLASVDNKDPVHASVPPGLSPGSSEKSSAIVVEVTKDDGVGGVALVGTLNMGRHENIELRVSQFGKENRLSPKQMRRLKDQLYLGLSAIRN